MTPLPDRRTEGRSHSTALEAIESRVQARARRVDLDPTTDGVDEMMSRLVTEEIRDWNERFRLGINPHELTDPDMVAERAMRNLTRYGPLTPLLEDDDVWEIMINAPDAVFVKRHRGRSGYHDEIFHDDEHVVRTITRILDASTTAHRKLDPSEGLQDAQLDDGARVHIVHGDLARGGHMLVNIRKFTGVSFRSLDELVERGMLTVPVADFLGACVAARCTIVFAGAPGSGKTTMLNCCAAELDPSLRVVVAEEVFESDIPLPNVASIQTRAARADRDEVDLRRLVAGFLRMAPDIAIVGEVRDREALPLLLTLSSGVKGFTTIHAGSAHQALTRLRFVSQLSDTANDVPMSALNSLVSEAVDVVVHCRRTDQGPRVTSVVCVEDLIGSATGSRFTVTDLFTWSSDTDLMRWTGLIPERLTRSFGDCGLDIRAILERSPGSSR